MRNIEDIAIVDSHHHLWDLTRFAYPWLRQPLRPRRFGDYSSICKNYLARDFLADTMPCRVVASVHIQAETGEDPIAETEWLAEQARRSGYPTAIIAKSDLTSPHVEMQLDRHQSAGPVVGVREPVHWSDDPIYGGHSAPDRIAKLRRAPGLQALSTRGMLLEVVSYFPQVPELIELLAPHPDLRVVIDHAGMPLHLDRHEPPFRDAEAGWRNAIRDLARLPNVHIKISGLWMAGRSLSANDVRPVIHHIVDCFGISRCMFGSNFPVDRVHASYREMAQTYLDCVSDLDDRAVHALFSANAQALYKLAPVK